MVDSVLLVEGVGILAGVLGLIAWMPQTFQIWILSHLLIVMLYSALGKLEKSAKLAKLARLPWEAYHIEL